VPVPPPTRLDRDWVAAKAAFEGAPRGELTANASYRKCRLLHDIIPMSASVDSRSTLATPPVHPSPDSPAAARIERVVASGAAFDEAAFMMESPLVFDCEFGA
jgi:hypothetical protein